MLEMVEDGHPDADLDFADGLMKEIPKLTKKIAGKSLPIEVRPCAQHWIPDAADRAEIRYRGRRASSSHRGDGCLCLLSSCPTCLGRGNSAPRRCLLKGQHGTDRRAPGQAADQTEDTYEGGHGYWDGESRLYPVANHADHPQTTAWVTSCAAWPNSCRGIK